MSIALRVTWGHGVNILSQCKERMQAVALSCLVNGSVIIWGVFHNRGACSIDIECFRLQRSPRLLLHNTFLAVPGQYRHAPLCL